MINDLKKSSYLKIRLTIKPKFISSTESNEKPIIYSKSDNSIVIFDKDTDETIQKLFDSLLLNYQMSLEQSMRERGSNFIFDYVFRMDYEIR